MIERCRDRQRRRNGFDNWKFHLIIEGLPFLLHASTFILTFGLFLRTFILFSYTSLIVLSFLAPAFFLYVWATVFGVLSEVRPYQTPISNALRGLWKIRYKIIPALSRRKRMLSRIYQVLTRRIRRNPPYHSSPVPLQNVPVQRPEKWLKSDDLATIKRSISIDVQCVSWVLWKIDSPEALSIAIKFAGTAWWSEKGLDAEPPYDVIVSTLKACFNSSRKLYPVLKDKAYYSARAILWIHIRAMCVSEELALGFPLPTIPRGATSHGDDLDDLFGVFSGLDAPGTLAWVYTASPKVTPAHQQWTWTALLHMTWAKRSVLGTFDSEVVKRHVGGDWSTVPLDAVLNRLLTWCIFLDWPVDKVVLMIQDKSYAIYYSCPLGGSLLFPAIIRNRSYLNYPKRLFRSSVLHILDAISSHTCYLI